MAMFHPSSMNPTKSFFLSRTSSFLASLLLFTGLFYTPVNAQQQTSASVWIGEDSFEGSHQPQITPTRILPAESASVTEHNASITWEHLLQQTSDWEGTLFGKPDWADRPSGERSEWITRERHAPGSVWEYNDVRVNVLALAALNVWRKPLPQVLKEHLMDKIGASPTWRWHGYENSWVLIDGVAMQSVSGGGHWGGGMFISARDQARFGLLTLREGNWKGEQVVSKDWINMSKNPTQARPNYGYMNYFLNPGQEAMPAAPETAFWHLGAGNNMVYVDPENDLVIVARWIQGSGMNGLIERVTAALQK